MTKEIEISQAFLPNIQKFNNKEIDHILAKNNAEIMPIIHGCPNGTVKFNGNHLKFSQLEPFIRHELNFNNNIFIIVKVYCCYSSAIVPFYGTNMWVIPAFNNEKELFYQPIIIDLRLFCKFSYS